MISSTLEVPLANSLRTLFHANVTDCLSPTVSAHVEYVPKWEPDPTPFAPHVNVAVTVTVAVWGALRPGCFTAALERAGTTHRCGWHRSRRFVGKLDLSSSLSGCSHFLLGDFARFPFTAVKHDCTEAQL